MRGFSFALICLLLAGSAGARAEVLADQPYRIAFDGRLVTDVYIDGQGPFAFVIDTASSRTLLYEHVRAKLGLAPSQPQQLTIYGINDVASAMPVKPHELRVGSEAIRGLTMGVLPVSADLPGGPDGVLGVDALARYFVVLDRAAMRFKLLAPGPDAARDYAGWSEMALTPHPLKTSLISFWYVKTQINAARFTTLLDLGAGVTMLNWQAAEKLGLHQRDFAHYGPPPEALRDVLGADAPALRLIDLTIGLGDRAWRNQLAVIANAPVFVWFNLDEQPAAIVGPGLLRDNSLAIDFANRRLYVGPTQE